MARAWYRPFEGSLWRAGSYAAGDGTDPPNGEDDLFVVHGSRESLTSRLPFDEVAVYKRLPGSTNMERIRDANRVGVMAANWHHQTDSERFLWFVGPLSSLGEVLTGPEANELAETSLVSSPSARYEGR